MILSSQTQPLEETESGNVTSAYPDHLPQFFFFLRFFLKNTSSKTQLRHDWRKFESNTFISDLDQTDCDQILCTEKSDVHFSMNKYLSKIDSLLEIHAPLKTLNKNKLKFLIKPMITQGLQNSKCKYQKLKEFYHN